jgi:adenylosuccinate lyase
MAELTRRGAGRQTAYALVRSCALKANQQNVGLEEIILTQNDIMQYLSTEEIHKIMDPHTYLGSAVKIVDMVLEESKMWF